MTKTRYINTKFWDDNYVIDLDPIEKLLFLYFLTNPLTNISGVYEISLRRIAFDTGIDSEMVLRILKRFQDDDKVFYIDGHLAIQNFVKNQSLNPSVVEGIKREIKLIPKPILDKLSEAGYRLSQEGLLNLTKPNLTKLNLTKPNTDKLYSAYKKLINSNSILTSKAKDKIDTRLKTFSEAQLLQAMENFSKDSWCMEHNSSRGMAWFFHSDDRIDQYINLKPRKSDDEVEIPDIAQEWMNK